MEVNIYILFIAAGGVILQIIDYDYRNKKHESAYIRKEPQFPLMLRRPYVDYPATVYPILLLSAKLQRVLTKTAGHSILPQNKRKNPLKRGLKYEYEEFRQD